MATQKRGAVFTTLKASRLEKLKELRDLYPDDFESDAAVLQRALDFAYPYLKQGKRARLTIEEVSEDVLLPDEEREEDSPTPELIPFELVGEVAAGKPIDCEIETEIVPLPKDHYERYKAKGGKLVRVRGDSMKEAGIKDGELIIFRPQKTAENGQIVVADIKGDGTVLKKFHAEKGMVVLTSMNADYAPLLKKAGEVVIHGLYLDSVRFS